MKIENLKIYSMLGDIMSAVVSRNTLTGYASIDNPHMQSSTFFEKHPFIPNMNIYTVLKLLSGKYLDSTAVDCKDLSVSYGTLLEDSVTFSLALKELGVKKGDIVSISMPNLYQGLVSFLACNRIGAVATFLDCYTSSDEIIDYLNLFESSVYINYDKDATYNIDVIDNTVVNYVISLSKKDVNSVNYANNLVVNSTGNIIDFSSIGALAQYQRGFEMPHSMNEDALILFTSGTTGKPKSVVLTNENVLAAEIYAKNTSHTENIEASKTLVCVPFMYPYGLITSALTSLLWGKETILAPDININNIEYYYSKKPNIVFGSPALLDLTMRGVPEDFDLSSVSHFISGGDFLTVQHAERGYGFFEKHGSSNVEIGNGFGNAETVSICSTPIGVPLRQETAGKLIVGGSYMILDPDTLEEKKYGEEGILYVAGRHIFKGYYNDPLRTDKSKLVRNGKIYYNTGTIGFIDESGYFFVTGRQSRFYIMSSLNKVYCDKIQNIISSFDIVEECAVVKVPDAEKLFVNKAYIVLDEGADYSSALDHINDLFLKPTVLPNGKLVQLKEYEIPTYIEFVSELPRKVGSDKIDYSFLEQDAEEKAKGKTLILR